MKGIFVLCLSVIMLLSLVVVPAQAATDEEITDSIEAGITWLVSQQLVDGSWQHDVAVTGFAVLKLEDKAFEEGYDSPFDEGYSYHENVINGLNYILGNVLQQAIAVQPAGDPDSNHNGFGAYCAGWEGATTYWTGIPMMAIAGSRSPDMAVVGGPYNGMTYKDVLQDMVDYLAWGQDEVEGAWAYSANEGFSDQSNSGYAVLGLEYAAAPIYGFNCSVPDWVKTELSRWIDIIQNPVDGDEYDGGSAYTTSWGVDYWVNLLKTGNLLSQMAFVGDDISTPRVQDAMDYIALHWYDSNLTQGWGWNTALVQYQAAYCLMKGLIYMGIPDDGIDGVTNWYMDLADEIIAEQNLDGSWPSSPAYVWPAGGWGYMSGKILSTEWALLTLEKFAPPPPVTIEVIKDYRYTNVDFEELDNDGDGLFGEDPIDGEDNDGDLLVDEDPMDTCLGSPLPMDEQGVYHIEAVVSKNGKISSYTPGQFYAVSTVSVLQDMDKLTIREEFGNIDPEIAVLNPTNGGGKVVIVKVGSDGIVRQILDAENPEVEVNEAEGWAEVTLGSTSAGTTIMMYVKFGPALKGETWEGDVGPCENFNRATTAEEPEEEDWVSASAKLILVEKD